MKRMVEPTVRSLLVTGTTNSIASTTGATQQMPMCMQGRLDSLQNDPPNFQACKIILVILIIKIYNFFFFLLLLVKC